MFIPRVCVGSSWRGVAPRQWADRTDQSAVGQCSIWAATASEEKDRITRASAVRPMTLVSQRVNSCTCGSTLLWRMTTVIWQLKNDTIFILFLRFVTCKRLRSIQWVSHSCRSGSVSADSWCGRKWTASDASPSNVLEEQASLPHRSLETLEIRKRTEATRRKLEKQKDKWRQG